MGGVERCAHKYNTLAMIMMSKNIKISVQKHPLYNCHQDHSHLARNTENRLELDKVLWLQGTPHVQTPHMPLEQ